MKELAYTLEPRLSWPAGFKRTAPTDRRDGRFGKEGRSINVPDALARLIATVDMFTRPGHDWRTTEVVITADADPARRGNTYLNPRREPIDPGACVYFRFDGKPVALPCDTYHRLADNLAAIAAHLEAMRGMERWGVGTVARLFEGFAALPPGNGSAEARPWWIVLGVEAGAPRATVESRYRDLAKIHHPDAGGDPATMAEINAAMEQAREGWR